LARVLNMTEIFISYSRKDKDFVHQLADALVAAKREIWVDWEDIPPAADWHAEIFAGIEAADSFVFVISPDSASSQVCSEELDHAIKNKKRLIPILYREAPTALLNPVISSHNWIYFRPADGFDKALQLLLKTLDTDLSYVRAHTRLLIRAIEWENKHKNPSFVLRGADLREAEQWRIASIDKKPEPTALHLEYIEASRKAASARQRVIASALAVGLVITLMLSVIAFQQYLTASAALKQSDANLQLANSNLKEAWTVQALYLASQAIRESRLGDSQTALQLVLQSAAHIAQGVFPDAIHQALFTALTMPGQEIANFPTGDGSELNGATWNADESRVLTWGFGARIWDVKSQKPLLTIAADSNVVQASWSKDESRVLTWAGDQIGTIWDASSGQSLYVFKAGNKTGQAAWNPAKDAVLFWSAGHQAQIVDAKTGTVRLSLPLNDATSVAWNSSGMMIATAAGADISIWDTQSGSALATFSASAAVNNLVWGPASDRLFTWSGDNLVTMWDWSNKKVLLTFQETAPTPGNSASMFGGIRFDSNEAHILTWTGNQAHVWNSADGSTVTLNHNDTVYGGAWNFDDSQLATWSNDGTVRIWDAKNGYVQLYALSHTASAYGAAWHPSKNMILSWSYDTSIKVWDTSSGQALYNLSGGSYLSGGQWSGDGNRILTWAHTEAHIFNGQNGQGEHNFPLYTAGDVVPTPLWSQDERQLLTVSSARTVTVWDADTMQALYTMPHSNPVLGALWSPDETRIVTWTQDGAITLWDATRSATSKEAKILFTVSYPQLLGVAWNKAGNQIVAWSKDRMIAFLDQNDGHVQRTLTHDEDGFTLLWSPDGSRLASWSAAEVKIWDMLTGVLLSTFRHSKLNQVAWSADNKQLLAASADGTISMLDTQTGKALSAVTAPAAVLDIAWNADSSRIFGSIDNGTVMIWDAVTSKLIRTLETTGSIAQMLVSPDGRRVVTAATSNVVTLWDANSGAVLDLYTHGEQVLGAVWNHDTTAVLSWSMDKNAIAEIPGKQSFVLTHPGYVSGGQWSKDNARILTWSSDGYAHIWLIGFDSLYALGQKSVLRPLDNQQLAQFLLPTYTPSPTPIGFAPSSTPTLTPTQVATKAVTPTALGTP
jgi:WD40 repeat protein